MSSPAPKAVSVSIFDSENRTLCDINAPIKDVHPANAVIAMTVITFDISIVKALDYGINCQSKNLSLFYYVFSDGQLVYFYSTYFYSNYLDGRDFLRLTS